MICFCSAKLNSLIDALATLSLTLDQHPPIPSIPLRVVKAVTESMNEDKGADSEEAAPATASETAAAANNLSTMASLSAALEASLGLDLTVALSASAIGSTQANLTAAINGFNANGGALEAHLGLLTHLQTNLLGLVSLSGLVTAIQVAFGIDLRRPGAIEVAQERLSEEESEGEPDSAAKATATAVSAVDSMMNTLDFEADAEGAVAVNIQAQALAELMAELPPIGANFQSLSLLNTVLTMRGAIRYALGVDLLLPSAAVDLRLALACLPISGLQQLDVSESEEAQEGEEEKEDKKGEEEEQDTVNIGASASVRANANAGLDLSGVAKAELSGVGQLSILLQAMAQGALSQLAGECDNPCALAFLTDETAMVS